MIKRLITILIAVISLVSTSAQTSVGNWKVYSMFSTIKKMVQTPDKVYFISGNNLFSFDKNTQETYNYTTKNKLNDIVVNNIYYNKHNYYLVVTYSTGNIDLIYDDGEVVNLPDIKDSGLNYSLDINDVAFNGDDIYVATKFGMVVFNEKRQEVKYSGVYDKEISTVTCVGDYVIVDQEHNLYYLHKDKRFEIFDNYTKISSGYWIEDMEGLNNNRLLFRTPSKAILLFDLDFEKNKVKSTDIDISKLSSNLIYGKDSYYYVNSGVVYSVSLDGEKSTVSSLPNEISSQVISIWDKPNELWVGDNEGIANYKINDGELTVLYDKFKPSAISVDYPFYITSDQNGKIYVSNKSESTIYELEYFVPAYVSTIYNGDIEDITPIEFTASHKSNPSKEIFYDAYQIVIDPEDPDIYYIGSHWEGMYKVKDRRTISQYNPETSSLLESWGCRVHGMAFDKENNLWCANEVLKQGEPGLHILPAKARKKEATTPEDWIPVYLGDFRSLKDVNILPCKKSDMVFVCDGKWGSYVVAYDTKGTYTDTSDDSYILWDSFIDQDGKSYDFDYATALVEDKNGRVWLGTSNGVIEISNPKNAINPSMTINRLKVPRNDGTNYADYLLDGIFVTSISVDNSNRKWIGTKNNGVYLVNEAGSEIIHHFTNENSYLPGGVTYCVYAHPFTNSVFMGTEYGLVEYSSDSSPAMDDYSQIYAYPNPVKPEYTGLITITGLMDNTLVKIADSAGNVFYTSRSEGGMVTWDGCNVAGDRVKSGVYFVYVSSNENEQSSGAVTKIMIIN